MINQWIERWSDGKHPSLQRFTYATMIDATKRILYLQHVPFEGLGSIEDWARDKGYAITAARLFEVHSLPAIADFDWLIVMGGPMGVYDEEKYPWLKDEKRFIEQTVKAGKVVIGICLGAQLIADVLGARVFRNTYPEIGWFPMRLQRHKEIDVLEDLPDTIDAFHWHGDTFDLPSGAVQIGSSDGCRNQGFVYSKNVYAFQFHLEVTLAGAQELIRNCSDELVEGKYIQTAAELTGDPQRFDGANHLMSGILNRIDRQIL